MADRKAYYRQWYTENKERLAIERHERYRSDPDYQERRKSASSRYYWMKLRRAALLKHVAVDVESIIPDEIADVIVSNEEDVRCGTVVPVPMYYPNTLAKSIRRSVQTIRVWALSGYIPESTYRNLFNYRIYTKDQLKVYVDNAHLLRLKVKNFKHHPFFIAVKEGLSALDPDGIALMPTSMWRLTDEKCKWCRSDIGMEHFKEDKWVAVPCFDCKDPYAIEERETVTESTVSGHCSFCDTAVSKQMHVINNAAVLVCDTCGRRLPNITIK